MQRSGRRPPLAFARTQNAMAATVQIAKTIHHASKTDLDRRLVELANAKNWIDKFTVTSLVMQPEPEKLDLRLFLDLQLHFLSEGMQ